MSQPDAEHLRQWAGCPQEMAFLETGTYTGETLAVAVEIFKLCVSIEVHPDFYLSAFRRFVDQDHVTLICGDSLRAIPAALRMIGDMPKLCWLDAHSAPEVKSRVYVPLLEEIQMVGRASTAHDVIVIDDTQAFGKWDFPRQDDWSEITWSTVEKVLLEHGFSRITRFCNAAEEWCDAGIIVARKAVA